MKVNSFSMRQRSRILSAIIIFLFLSIQSLGQSSSFAQDSGSNTMSGDGGQQDSGGNAMISEDTGVAVNGSADGSNINNNQNNLSTGSNTNLNLLAPTSRTNSVVNPIIYTPNAGGSSVMVMPRNPLPLPNAALGRSNFGFQFGLQNNPGMGSLLGNGNALGWFMQGGVTIPFGKIPDELSNARNSKLDDIRQENLERERMVFGNLNPKGSATGTNTVKKNVQGQVMGLGAYNLTTLPSGKIGLPEGMNDAASVGEIRLPQPKILALTTAEVYSRPLNTGDKVGAVETGIEYPYLGHTRSGWVKIMLPNGREGWTSTHFEYIKNDFTEIDTLAVDPNAHGREKKAELPSDMSHGQQHLKGHSGKEGATVVRQ